VGVHAALVLGLVSISQPHLSKSSPHEQPIGTSQLAGRCPNGLHLASPSTRKRACRVGRLSSPKALLGRASAHL
jgi:hypothetical protein